MSNPKMDPKVIQAMKKEGFLGKQTRGVYLTYHKRYWLIQDDGLTLSYGNSKQEILNGNLKGKLALKDILSIHEEGKPKKFHLILEGRVYKLEAASVEDKREWMDALKICVKYAQDYEDKEQKDLKAIDDDIIFEEEHDKAEEKNTSKLLKPLGFVTNTVKTIAVDTALNTAVKILKTGVNTVGNVIIGEKVGTNEDFLKAKGLSSTLDHIDNKILKSRLIMGYLLKEKKEATGLGLVDDLVNDAGFRDTLSKNWFMLISSKPIIFDDIDPDDNSVLDAGQLPIEVDLETLYIYDKACDDSQPLETIPMNDVTDITIKKKKTEEISFRFELNLGERKILLITDSMQETTRWVKAFQASRATVKEQAKSKLGVVKNIYWHKKIYDEQGEEKLAEKIEKEYEDLVAKHEAQELEGITGILALQKIKAEEIIAVINACLVHRERRLDIIQLNINIYHENIIASLRNYFKRNQADFTNLDCFEIIKFLVWYRDMLLMFGPGFADKRMIDGIATLCSIITSRILRSNLDSIQNIIQEELETAPTLDGKNRVTTNGPQDIFRIVNESFTVLTHCNYKEFACALLTMVKNTLLNYQGGLNYIIEECKLSFDQLGALCNNTMTYMSNTKQFIDQVEALSALDHETISQYLDEEKLNKGFVDVSKRAYETIAQEQFSYLREEWRNKAFLEIDLKTTVEDKLQEIQITTEKIHSNYTSKIELSCLEKIAALYIQNFLKNAERKLFRKEDCSKISEKLDDDYNYLKDVFLRSLKANIIENVITPIRHFHDFLNTNYAFLNSSVKTMKETYGKAIKWQTIELLVKVRNDDLDQNEKAELLKQCEDAYKQTHERRDRSQTYNVFKHVNQQYDDNSAEDELDDSTEEEDNSSEQRSSLGLSKSMSMSFQHIEGYLEAEKDEFVSALGDAMGGFIADLKFDRLYFTIRKDVMYYYKSKSSETAMGSYKLKDVIECFPFERELTAFYIKFRTKSGDVKKSVFKAENVEKRGQWISAINAAMTFDVNTLLEVASHEAQFFKDTKPIFTNVEGVIDIKFELRFRLMEEELPVDAPRRSTVVFRRDTRKSMAKQENIGCFAKFCRIFGFGKKKPPADDDYMSFNHDEVL